MDFHLHNQLISNSQLCSFGTCSPPGSLQHWLSGNVFDMLYGVGGFSVFAFLVATFAGESSVFFFREGQEL